jgi:hypothetical protein
MRKYGSGPLQQLSALGILVLRRAQLIGPGRQDFRTYCESLLGSESLLAQHKQGPCRVLCRLATPRGGQALRLHLFLVVCDISAHVRDAAVGVGLGGDDVGITGRSLDGQGSVDGGDQ